MRHHNRLIDKSIYFGFCMSFQVQSLISCSLFLLEGFYRQCSETELLLPTFMNANTSGYIKIITIIKWLDILSAYLLLVQYRLIIVLVELNCTICKK